MENRAVVLLSGGLDSATVLALCKRKGYRLHTLSFRYGQRHHAELLAAQALADVYQVERHVIVDIDLRLFGGSALTTETPIPKHRSPSEIGSGIPNTYVPARNTIFLSYALAYAEVVPASHIFLGINALDYSGYPDCRPAYLAAFQKLARLATRAGVSGIPIRLHAPLLHKSKAQIIALGLRLGVDYSLTRSCYDLAPDGTSCGACDACLLRLAGFQKNGMTDPAPYNPSPYNTLPLQHSPNTF